MTPKMFISYSWSNPDHEQWVLQLATELVEAGVEVLLDKWDLREGHDANAFMEKMVTDPTVTKVALICDETYVVKTNSRNGGVGTEAQIISPELYSKQNQSKFVAIVRERDSEGKAYLPAYYKSRIYIDLSDDSSYSENFDKLLRWAYDKPLHQKPVIGKMPAFLVDADSTIHLSTSTKYKRAIEQLRSGSGNPEASVSEYFQHLALEFEKFRIPKDKTHTTVDQYEQTVLDSIDQFTPYRNEVIEIIYSIASYRDNAETIRITHQFFESILPYLFRPEHIRSWNETDFDNFRFIVHELFLYTVSIYIKLERFDSANHLLSNLYYIAGETDYGRTGMRSFRIFDSTVSSLLHLREKKETRYLAPRAQLLKDRCKSNGIQFRHIMQTEFIMWLRRDLAKGENYNWFPDTLLYTRDHGAPFEIFAKSRSTKYFERVKNLIAINSKENLADLIEHIEKYKDVPRWEMNSFNPRLLAGLDDIATIP